VEAEVMTPNDPTSGVGVAGVAAVDDAFAVFPAVSAAVVVAGHELEADVDATAAGADKIEYDLAVAYDYLKGAIHIRGPR
jgi:hypothetical protein